MTYTYLKNSRIKSRCTHREHDRWRPLRTFIAFAGIVWMPLVNAAPTDLKEREAAGVEALMTRVGPPSEEAVDEFKRAGMAEVRPHVLTNSERAKVQVALASLPRLNRHVLDRKLHRLAFVDGIPGEGTGLTSPDAKTGLYDVTLRASILDESLSTFLTGKERRVFTENGSGITVEVDGTGTDALTYVLLHESTHVVDQSCGVMVDPRSQFMAGIWASETQMVPALASSSAAKTVFRGVPPRGVEQAPIVYDALAQTPFVSLYATASAHEDFAELVAWHEVLKQHHGNLVLRLHDARGKTLRQWEPLNFPGVQKRFADVDLLLASHTRCSRLPLSKD